MLPRIQHRFIDLASKTLDENIFIFLIANFDNQLKFGIQSAKYLLFTCNEMINKDVY